MLGTLRRRADARKRCGGRATDGSGSSPKPRDAEDPLASRARFECPRGDELRASPVHDHVFAVTTLMLLGVLSRLSTLATGAVLLTMYHYFGLELGREPWTHHHTYLLTFGTYSVTVWCLYLAYLDPDTVHAFLERIQGRESRTDAPARPAA
jgi:hypothetical protein